MRLDDAVKAVNESFFIMLGGEGIRHFCSCWLCGRISLLFLIECCIVVAPF